MEISFALLIYIIIFIFIFIIAQLYKISLFSSITGAILVSLITLSALYPISLVEKLLTNNPLVRAYILIQLFSIFIILLYLVAKIITDKTCIQHMNLC